LFLFIKRAAKNWKTMHYYQFNIGDYKSHTEHLSEMEDLTYRRLLDWYYLHETPIPLEINETARQIRMRSHSECIALVLQEYFERTEIGWIHHRADKEIAKTGEKSEKASASAKARWNRAKDANALQTQSESNATQNTEHITQDTKHKKNATVVATPEGVSQYVWQEFVFHRKAKRAKVTDLVVEGIAKEAEKAGWSLEDALKETVVRGWQSFKADWVAVKESPADKRQNHMAQLTRGMSTPKPQPFWSQSTTVLEEIPNVEPKRLL
jgi:uncharacterized protein YdaU (DUF1376 family)